MLIAVARQSDLCRVFQTLRATLQNSVNSSRHCHIGLDWSTARRSNSEPGEQHRQGIDAQL